MGNVSVLLTKEMLWRLLINFSQNWLYFSSESTQKASHFSTVFLRFLGGSFQPSFLGIPCMVAQSTSAILACCSDMLEWWMQPSTHEQHALDPWASNRINEVRRESWWETMGGIWGEWVVHLIKTHIHVYNSQAINKSWHQGQMLDFLVRKETAKTAVDVL